MLTRSALIYLSRQEWLKDFAARFSLFKRLTTRFVAGESIDEAVDFIRELNAEGCSASFDHLNESVANPAEAEGEVKEYRQILNTDAAAYGGSTKNAGAVVRAEKIAQGGKPYSISIAIPALSTVALKLKRTAVGGL